MRLKATLLILLVLLLSLSLAGSVRAECYAYPGAQPTDYDLPYGYNCANTGSGCQQCVDYNQNGSGRACTYDWWGWVVSCYYWGPEFQNL